MTVVTVVKWAEKEAAIRALEHKGRVDPLELIEAARDPSHPCHGDFTWDMEQAAAERWRDQARAIIRKCKFEVLVEDVTERVVQYIESPDEDDSTFLSLSKVRSASKTSAVMASELASLHGLASRVHGIAISKVNIVGTGVVARLKSICGELAALKKDLNDYWVAARLGQARRGKAGRSW